MTTHLNPDTHPFLRNPHRTLFTLSIPVTLSLIAEPITGMVDTAFVAQLGSIPLAALGIGTIALTTVFWVFSFLSVSTQTEVAQAMGSQNTRRAMEITSLALILSAGFGVGVIVVLFPLAETVSAVFGASAAVQGDAATYIRIRLLGAPAVLAMFIGYGALRGLQDMRTPLLAALAVNVMNIVLDALLVNGIGPLSAMGVAGAALASSISQWMGAAWLVSAITRRLGFRRRVHLPDVWALLRVGGNVFMRVGVLTLFIMLSSRVANQISPEAGAAHQVIRTLWLFFAYLMDGFAVTAQSLVGFFLGAQKPLIARRAARLVAQWSLGIGLALSAIMLLATEVVILLFVPPDAEAAFRSAWALAVLAQPVAALAFVTDGIHQGSADYAFLRNTMLAATLIAGSALFSINPASPHAFATVWLVTLSWVMMRAVLGLTRVWPGIGQSPLRPYAAAAGD